MHDNSCIQKAPVGGFSIAVILFETCILMFIFYPVYRGSTVHEDRTFLLYNFCLDRTVYFTSHLIRVCIINPHRKATRPSSIPLYVFQSVLNTYLFAYLLNPLTDHTSNFGQMFTSIRQGAEFMIQSCQVMVKVTFEGRQFESLISCLLHISKALWRIFTKLWSIVYLSKATCRIWASRG